MDKSRKGLPMSSKQQLRDSGLFTERLPQRNGTVSFTVRGGYGATIYVMKNDADFRIRTSPMDTGRFPNHERLRFFVLAHAHRSVLEGGPAYEVSGKYLGDVIRIIRAGQGRSDGWLR